MKTTFTFLLVILFVNFSLAQKEETEKTTITFKNGRIITITSSDEEDTTIVKGEEDGKWNVHHWRGLEFGMNGYFTSDDLGINNDPDNVYLELDYGKSFMINLNLFEYNTGLGTEKVRFFTGLGLRFNRYAFKSTHSTLTYNDSTIYKSIDSTKSFDKNFLNATYISLPVYFTLMPGKNPHKSFHISAGAIVNYRIGSRIKQKYVMQDQKRKDIEKGHYHLNPFLIDASVRVGIGHFSIYANYGLNGLFESSKGPDYNPFSIGLSLNI